MLTENGQGYIITVLMKYRPILVNRAMCLLCGETIESRFTHEFKTCKCGEVSVDGGKDYLKRVYGSKQNVVELSEFGAGVELTLNPIGSKLTSKS
jgi:hypothetical protein